MSAPRAGNHAPLVPPIPSGFKRRRGPVRDRRWLLWLAALALGIALGFGGYRLKPVASYFDYWVARATL